MSENAIDSVKATPEPAAAKQKRKAGKKAKPAKKARHKKVLSFDDLRKCVDSPMRKRRMP